MKKGNLDIDIARCHDCNDCFLADKDEFVGNDWAPTAAAQPWHGHRWLNIESKERGQHPIVQVTYFPKPCMHCDEAPCLTADGAVYKREDGLVIIDPVKAAGRREIVDSCPYGAIYWNDEKQLAQKCTGCAHLMDAGWKDTRCSQVCPTDAIKLVLADDDEMARLATAEGLEVCMPELGSRPRVYYKNMYRWTRAFIAANVVFGDTDEVAEGATLSVEQGGKAVGDAVSNNYGDALVDKLIPGVEYVVTIAADGYKSVSRTVKLDQSLNLGHVFLERAS